MRNLTGTTVAVLLLLLSSSVMAKEDSVLDLRIVDMGYRWTQDLEEKCKTGAAVMSSGRVFMTFGITKQDFLRFGWNHRNITHPFDKGGKSTVMFQFTHKFESM
jgi:hypothetical protein